MCWWIFLCIHIFYFIKLSPYDKFLKVGFGHYILKFLLVAFKSLVFFSYIGKIGREEMWLGGGFPDFIALTCAWVPFQHINASRHRTCSLTPSDKTAHTLGARPASMYADLKPVWKSVPTELPPHFTSPFHKQDLFSETTRTFTTCFTDYQREPCYYGKNCWF